MPEIERRENVDGEREEEQRKDIDALLLGWATKDLLRAHVIRIYKMSLFSCIGWWCLMNIHECLVTPFFVKRYLTLVKGSQLLYISCPFEL